MNWSESDTEAAGSVEEWRRENLGERIRSRKWGG